MWDAWSNGREPPSAIPGFTELIPRSSEVTNAPVPNPLIPCGYPPMLSNVPCMPSVVRPQAPGSRAPPPLFIFQGPQLQAEITYVTPYSFTQPPQCDLSVEQENVVKNPEQEEMARKIKSLEQSLKIMQGLSVQKSVSYSDLCMFPHVHLPVGFKMPKFEKHDGRGDSVAHLKRYCNQLRGASGKEELLMAYFEESLIGFAFEWYTNQEITHWHVWEDMARDFIWQFQYNVDISPDRNTLSNLKKKTAESFCENAVKWHEQVSRVKPPMDEIEMVAVFLQAQEADYFQNMMSDVDVQNGSEGLMNKNGVEEGTMIVSSFREARRLFNQSYVPPMVPPYYYPLQDVVYAVASPPYAVMNAQPYPRPQHYPQNRAPLPRNTHPHQAPYNPERNDPQYNPRPREYFRKNQFTPIGESYSSLFQKLIRLDLLQPVAPNRPNLESHSHRANAICEYLSRAVGHSTEDCWTLKRVVEDLIEVEGIVFRDEEAPDVMNNLFPAHNIGPIFEMICEAEEFDPTLKAIAAILEIEEKPKNGRQA
ncbi:uncharacterized protein [Nicotiana sylvestris]|uniref:uncharacterized protein n=1 Tax=Nicotiana sylvestris TaxID=4096 RepID=UPI00388CD40B